MAEILTTNFKTDTTRLFANDVISNEYYLLASSISGTESTNSIRSKNGFLEKTLFGKKILNDDFFYMIKYYPWQTGIVYTQYDDFTNLEDTNFYAVVGPNSNDTGDYRVYKCLNNNFGAEVTSPPNYSEVTVDQVYRTADGYVWKFMYVMTELQFDAYNAVGYIPITGAFDVDPIMSNGSSISDIILGNRDFNSGYTEELGIINATPAGSSGSLTVRPTTAWNPTTNYYTGQSLYVTNSISGTSFVYEIVYYVFNTGVGLPEIRVNGNPVADGVERDATFKIIPRIQILGDGTGAVAVPVLIDGRIDSIVILNSGSGYNNISVSVIDPAFNFDPENTNTSDVRASVRGILSPKDGHAYNLLEEFKCKHILLYAYITEENNNNIGATNTYGTVGVVKNPVFANTSPDIFDNRIAVTTDDIASVLTNSIITQVNSNNDVVFSAKVHEVDLSSNTMFLAEYCGPYQDTGNTDISFDQTLPFRSETGQTVSINTPINENIIISEYIQRTGEVYFMEDFFPLDRTDLSREEFKLVLEF